MHGHVHGCSWCSFLPVCMHSLPELGRRRPPRGIFLTSMFPESKLEPTCRLLAAAPDKPSIAAAVDLQAHMNIGRVKGVRAPRNRDAKISVRR